MFRLSKVVEEQGGGEPCWLQPKHFASFMVNAHSELVQVMNLELEVSSVVLSNGSMQIFSSIHVLSYFQHL